MQQEMQNYTAQDKWVWNTLFERQHKNLKGKASSAYLESLNSMSEILNRDELPDFKKINQWFEPSTAWQIEVVKG